MRLEYFLIGSDEANSINQNKFFNTKKMYTYTHV